MTAYGEIWLTEFGIPAHHEPADLRPALLVGHTEQYGDRFPYVLLVPMTTTDRQLGLHVEIDPDPPTGLDETCFIQCELLRSVGRTRLLHQLGVADAVALSAVDRRLRALLGH